MSVQSDNSLSAKSMQSDASPWKRMFQSTAVYGLALVGQRIGTMAMLILYTRFLTPRDFGILDILENFSSLLSVIIGSNFPSALFYLYARQSTDEQRRTAMGTSVLGALILGFVGLAVGLLVAPACARWLFGNDASTLYVVLAFTGLGYGLLLESLFAWLRLLDRTVTYMIVAVGRTFIGISLAVILLAVFGLKIEGVLWSTLVGGIVCTAWLLWLFLRETGLAFSRQQFVEMIWITIPVTLGSLSQFAIHFGDRFFLKEYAGLENLGMYSLAYKFSMLLSVAFSSFNTYWSSQIVGIYRREDREPVVARTFSYLAAVLGALAVGLIVLSKPFLLTFTAPAYFGALAFIPALVFAYLVRSLCDFFRSFFIVMSAPKADSIVNLCSAAVCVAGYFILIPRFGAWGAIVSTVLAFLVMLTMTVTWVLKSMHVTIEAARLVKVVVAAVVSLTLFSFLGASSKIALWGLSFGILASYPAILWGTGFFTINEKAWLHERFRQYWRRGAADVF